MATRRRICQSCGVALGVVLGAGAMHGAAPEWPSLKPGKWKFERTVEGMAAQPQKLEKTECLDPVARFREQEAQLTKVGCTFSPLVHDGKRTSYSATCTLSGSTTVSRSVLEVESAEAYRLTVDSEFGGRKTHEILVARRLGDCALP